MGLNLNIGRPLLTVMLLGSTPEELLPAIANGVKQGADGFCLQLERLQPQYRSYAVFKNLIKEMSGRFAYITDYRRENTMPEKSEEQLVEELLTAVDCGAELFDVRCDLYDPQPEEVSFNLAAEQKQQALIGLLHQKGVKTVMSTHVFTNHPKSWVLKVAALQKARGADVIKIVNTVDTNAQLQESLELTKTLQNKLNMPFIYLCNGLCCKPHRKHLPLLNEKLLLCINQREYYNTAPQPSLEQAKQLLLQAGYAF